ncbi:MAG: glutamate-5-semialdehyde dehydrogenase [Desulfovibrio sp.]|nr:glutamate-5-semialdehyde dehydrogenase [Desulfovibrio sp.]
MSIADVMREMGEKAQKAATDMNRAKSMAKIAVLETVERLLDERKGEILEANGRDLANAMARGLDAPRMDRLRLTETVLSEMKKACRHVASLPDPIGSLEKQWMRPNGLRVGKMRVPLGVVAMIYESRPNVTVDAAILCLKAGNAVILRGGSEAIESNMVLATILRDALEQNGLSPDAVQLVTILDHAAVTELCHLDSYIDVMIPRGGEGLVRAVTREATMPVLKHFKGVCHAVIDSDCDLKEALEIVYNSKVQRPGVCNALECLLVHQDVAKIFLPMVYERLDTVEFRCCERSLPLMGERAKPLSREDLGQEFHALILTVIVVSNLDEAFQHIARYGSRHTEVICTGSLSHAERFTREVDASMVGVNCSTRFNDGGQLGLGAEIGISTSKLHAFGPMGVKELTTTKFVVIGNGQVREG